MWPTTRKELEIPVKQDSHAYSLPRRPDERRIWNSSISGGSGCYCKKESCIDKKPPSIRERLSPWFGHQLELNRLGLLTSDMSRDRQCDALLRTQ